VTFVPLFALALVLGRREARRLGMSLIDRLRLGPMDRSQWLWTLAGVLAVLVGTGAIRGLAELTLKALGFPKLETTPGLMAFEPFRGGERLLLLIWAPMFFFNIVGEELFFRGYILPRQELAFPRGAWLLNACLWALFHVAFGWQLLLVLLPILFVQPYIAQRTRSTWPGIVIHGVLNGPMFVAIALGVLG
jgi:membrane protease YdiL (CAAX protease family)